MLENHHGFVEDFLEKLFRDMLQNYAGFVKDFLKGLLQNYNGFVKNFLKESERKKKLYIYTKLIYTPKILVYIYVV